jgi:hypothetical protein
MRGGSLVLAVAIALVDTLTLLDVEPTVSELIDVGDRS